MKATNEVVVVDQENDYSVDFMAKDFETFIKGLKCEEDMSHDLSKRLFGIVVLLFIVTAGCCCREKRK